MSILSYFSRTGGIPDHKQYLSNEVAVDKLSRSFLECVATPDNYVDKCDIHKL